MGPAALVQLARFIMDSRDLRTNKSLSHTNIINSIFYCKNIMSCVNACPKALDPSKAIEIIRKKIIEQK